MRALAFGGLCLVAAMATTTVARAAPWEPKTKSARTILDRGREAFRSGDYAAAASIFLESDAAESSLNARWNAAQAFAAAGEWKRAAELLDQLTKDTTLPKKRRADVEKRHRIAVVFVAADFAAEAQRWDDARDVLRNLLADPAIGDRDRASASAAIEAVAQKRAQAEAAAGTERERREAEAARAAGDADDSARGPTDSASPGDPRPIQAPNAADRPSRLGDVVAWSLLGVGAASAGIGGGLVWNAGQLEDDANNEPDEGQIVELRDRASSRRTAGLIALGVGGGLLIAGAIKLALPPDAPRTTTATLQPTSGGAMVVVGGAF